MAKTLTRTIVQTAVSVAAGGTQRATFDCTAFDGGAFLTAGVTNGATGPTAPCVVKVYVSHATTMPAAAAESSADDGWKLLAPIGTASTANSARSGFSIDIPPAARFVQVEWSGHTGQAITADAQATGVA